jgi:hypothetical protein
LIVSSRGTKRKLVLSATLVSGDDTLSVAACMPVNLAADVVFIRDCLSLTEI